MTTPIEERHRRAAAEWWQGEMLQGKTTYANPQTCYAQALADCERETRKEVEAEREELRAALYQEHHPCDRCQCKICLLAVPGQQGDGETP